MFNRFALGGIRRIHAVGKWPSYEQTMTKKNFAERQHAVGTTRMWFWFNLILTYPALIATMFYTIPPEYKHIQHIKAHPEEKAEWKPFSYMRKRVHEYPWGDDALFHHPSVK